MLMMNLQGIVPDIISILVLRAHLGMTSLGNPSMEESLHYAPE